MPGLNVAMRLGVPIFDVEVWAGDRLRADLERRRVKIMEPCVGEALIDTGCSHCFVAEHIIADMQLAPTGTLHIQTASTRGAHEGFPSCELAFKIRAPGCNAFLIRSVECAITKLPPMGPSVLIGRNALQACRCWFDWPSQRFGIDLPG